MNELSLPQLGQPYQAMLADGRFEEYVFSLCEEGISWWFEMRIPEIAAHLTPLQNAPVVAEAPPRILFLVEVVKQLMSVDVFEQLYLQFITQGDLEGAAAAACAGATSIWDSGVNFERFVPWFERINTLIDDQESLSNLTRAGLLCFRAEIELTFHGDVAKAAQTYNEMMSQSEKAGSLSLKVFAAAGQVYPLFWLGRLSEIDALMMSTKPLLNHPEVSLFCNVYHHTFLGYWLAIKGEPAKAEQILSVLVGQPFFSMLPLSIQLLALNHLLHALALQRKASEVLLLVDRILAIATPLGSSFHNAYAHYCVGVAALLLAEPRKALTHAREAGDRALASSSPVTENTHPLLTAQALIDLGETEKGRADLSEWIDVWSKGGFPLLASTGLVELAALFLKQGKVDAARDYYERATALIPAGEVLCVLNRPASFIANLQRSLFPDANGVEVSFDPQDYPVRISTFGELKVEIAGKTTYDRKWRGMSTKNLLKLILALGGKKVSNEVVADLLWPDADGATAAQNLKVAIHRLRKVGIDNGATSLPWLVSKHKHISLSGSLCFVDSIRFDAGLSMAMQNGGDKQALIALLSLYSDDFLPHDTNEPWIVQRREMLRNKFVSGTLCLSQIAIAQADYELPLPYLALAIEKAPEHEGLYEQLMLAELHLGNHSKVLSIFKQAEQVLESKLHTTPGAKLLALAHRAQHHLT